jgi:hypothetical protein
MAISARLDNEVRVKKPKSVATAPKFSLANWGAEDKAIEFESVDQVFKLIDELGKQGVGDNFLYFKNVSERDFEVLDEERPLRGRSMKLCHISDIKLLIVQIVSRPHESVNAKFVSIFERKLTNMGVKVESELDPVRAARIKWQTRTGPQSKEGDCAYARAESVYPHFVVETGVTETMERLRGDAALWISSRKVRFVLVIKIDRRNLKMTLEQWIPIPENPNERIPQVQADRIGKSTTINLEDFKILPNKFAFRLEFERVVGRPHNPPREKATILLSKPDLIGLAEIAKRAIQKENTMNEEVAMEEAIMNAIEANR